jgi:hypothetical protein
MSLLRHQSKQSIVKQVCELEFLFFAMLYDQGVLQAILFLSPLDKELIQSLPDFKSFQLILGINGHSSGASR